jgi:hypothetical protein
MVLVLSPPIFYVNVIICMGDTECTDTVLIVSAIS